jgi:hypothetical protein
MAAVDWTEVEALGSVAAAAVAAGGLIYAGVQFRGTRRTSEAQLLLDLEKQFDESREVHTALRPGGIWSSGDGPEEEADWVKVDDYMGLFELLNALLQDKLVTRRHISQFYLYRLHNIWENNVIIEGKLGGDEVTYWTGFIEISQTLGVRQADGYDLRVLKRQAAEQGLA